MPLIQRRPSRIIAEPPRQTIRQNPAPPAPPGGGPVGGEAPLTPVAAPAAPAQQVTALARSPEDMMDMTEQLSSSRSRPTLLRVRVEATPEVAFTTTLSVPNDMYIADLTEVLVSRKNLHGAACEWVLCLANKRLALPLDRTVASLGSNTELALVTRKWAVENGLGTGGRRGGDPNANIFKRTSEYMPPDLAAFTKYTVFRKTGIGKHERVLAIDGDYIHVSYEVHIAAQADKTDHAVREPRVLRHDEDDELPRDARRERPAVGARGRLQAVRVARRGAEAVRV